MVAAVNYELRTGHRQYQCKRECSRPGTCPYCDGGLFLCTICGALEGALLPKCPGRWLTMAEHEKNYADYCAGTGPFAEAS